MRKELSDRAIKYLQSISKIQQEKGSVRQIDVARDLDVKPSSCFSAILGLIRKGYVLEQESKHLILSDEAQHLVDLFRRNDSLLSDFFIDVLGVPEDQATEDIQCIEHHISIDTSIRLCKFIRFLHEKYDFSEFKKEFEAFHVDVENSVKCEGCPQKKECKVFQADDS